MRSLAFVILLGLVAQGRSSLLADLEKEIKESMEQEVKSVVEPLTAEARLLRDRLTAMKASTMDLQLYSVGDMNYESCARLADTIEKATQAAWNATLTGYSLAQNVSNTIWGLINCPGINPVKSTKCFYDDLKDVKNEITQAKPLITSMRQEVRRVVDTVERLYLECVGKAVATTMMPHRTRTQRL